MSVLEVCWCMQLWIMVVGFSLGHHRKHSVLYFTARNQPPRLPDERAKAATHCRDFWNSFCVLVYRMDLKHLAQAASCSEMPRKSNLLYITWLSSVQALMRRSGAHCVWHPNWVNCVSGGHPSDFALSLAATPSTEAAAICDFITSKHELCEQESNM